MDITVGMSCKGFYFGNEFQIAFYLGMDWKKSISRGIRGSLNKFPDLFRMDTFIDSTHIKL